MRWVVALVGISCGSFAAASASASPDAEREALARIVHEITALEPLIAEAEGHATDGGRYTFQYGWLRQDLARVQLGIREHLDSPRREPRMFEPLRGDYRR